MILTYSVNQNKGERQIGASVILLAVTQRKIILLDISSSKMADNLLNIQYHQEPELKGKLLKKVKKKKEGGGRKHLNEYGIRNNNLSLAVIFPYMNPSYHLSEKWNLVT